MAQFLLLLFVVTPDLVSLELLLKSESSESYAPASFVVMGRAANGQVIHL